MKKKKNDCSTAIESKMDKSVIKNKNALSQS